MNLEMCVKQKQVFSEESQSVENDFLKQQIKIRNKISALLRNDVEIEQILAVLLKYFAADGTALYRLTASTTVDQDNPIDVHYYPEHSVNLPCSECPLIALAKKGGCHNVQRISDLCPSVQPSCVFHPNAEAMLILCGKVRNRHYVLFLQRNEIPFSVSEYHLLRSLKPLLFNILIYKLNQEETRTLQEQLSLRQHHNAIGYFARGISHELNTPLQSLIGNLLFVRSAVEDLFLLIDELAKLSSGTNEIDRHLFDSKVRHLIKDKEMDYIADELPLAFLDSMKAKKKIADLIGLFRDFSFPGDFKMVSVDLNILLERALLASGFASQSKLKIRKNLDLELKPVICSEAGMYEVFLNLIVNAIYAVEDMDGGDNGVIEVTTRQVDDAVEISIFDNGAGIPMEIQDKVFSPFFTTKASPQFAGNGLAIVYDQVVVRHGGQVSCQSLEGEGTTMVVALPFKSKLEVY